MQQCAAPDQDSNLQVGPRLDQRTKKLPQQWAFRLIWTQLDAAVEIPTDDQDGLRGLPQRLFQSGIIFGCINQNRGLICFGDIPTIAAGLQDAWSRPFKCRRCCR
jgi:hypothetical protein